MLGKYNHQTFIYKLDTLMRWWQCNWFGCFELISVNCFNLFSGAVPALKNIVYSQAAIKQIIIWNIVYS